MLSLLLSRPWTAGLAASMALFASAAGAQPPESVTSLESSAQSTSDVGAAKSADQRISDLSREVEELKNLVQQLQDQISKVAPAASTVAAATQPPASGVAETPAAAAPKVTADLLRGMTINAMLDTYYEYNFNSPVGRVNYLRAYDVSS